MINPHYYSPIPHDQEKENLKRVIVQLTRELTLSIACNNALQVRLNQRDAQLLEITQEAEKLQRQIDLLNEVPY